MKNIDTMCTTYQFDFCNNRKSEQQRSVREALFDRRR